uniref:DNA-directed DNA polymerase n=1 Tax=Echinococcus granulosus TaxID=6210 RepID=A0A068X5D5_ECHGR|nr:hypothetical protein EgrG_002063400 [Echinococcus granulosus]
MDEMAKAAEYNRSGVLLFSSQPSYRYAPFVPLRNDETGEKTKLMHQVSLELGTRRWELIHFLFDIDLMTGALLECEVDLAS